MIGRFAKGASQDQHLDQMLTFVNKTLPIVFAIVSNRVKNIFAILSIVNNC